MKSINPSNLWRGLGVLLLAGGLLAPGARAQTGEDALRFSQRFPAVGARMVGLGGAGIAGVGDFGALFANPAGLAYIERSELSGALNTLATTDEGRFSVPNFPTNTTERDIRDTRLGSLSYVYRAPTVRGSFVVAASYNQVSSFDRNLGFSGSNAVNALSQSFLPYDNEFVVEVEDGGGVPVFYNDIPALAYNAGAIEFYQDLYDQGEYPFEPAAWFGTAVDQEGRLLEEGQMRELSFGTAAEASKGVMIGLGANLVFGTYRFESLFEEFDAAGENADYSVEGGDYAGFEELIYRSGFESNLTGFNLRGGVSAMVAPSVRLGLSLETPTFYTVDEDYFSDLETVFSQGGSLADRQNGTFEYTVTTPWRMGAGLAFVSGDLLLSGDVEYVDWSQMELDSDADDFAEANREIRDVLEPVLNTRIGAEYRVGALALRGGFGLQPDPRDYSAITSEDQVDRSKTFFSAGFGYHFGEQFALDLGWMQERFDDFYQPYSDVEGTPPVVDESVVRNRFVVGVRVGF